MSSPAFTKNTLFVVTFDEDDSNTDQNRVYTVVFGPDIKWSSTARENDKYYNHYSLLRTIEDNVSWILRWEEQRINNMSFSGISAVWEVSTRTPHLLNSKQQRYPAKRAVEFAIQLHLHGSLAASAHSNHTTPPFPA